MCSIKVNLLRNKQIKDTHTKHIWTKWIPKPFDLQTKKPKILLVVWKQFIYKTGRILKTANAACIASIVSLVLVSLSIVCYDYKVLQVKYIFGLFLWAPAHLRIISIMDSLLYRYTKLMFVILKYWSNVWNGRVLLIRTTDVVKCSSFYWPVLDTVTAPLSLSLFFSCLLPGLGQSVRSEQQAENCVSIQMLRTIHRRRRILRSFRIWLVKYKWKGDR